jgi:hypothetical protein
VARYELSASFGTLSRKGREWHHRSDDEISHARIDTGLHEQRRDLAAMVRPVIENMGDDMPEGTREGEALAVRIVEVRREELRSEFSDEGFEDGIGFGSASAERFPVWGHTLINARFCGNECRVPKETGRGPRKAQSDPATCDHRSGCDRGCCGSIRRTRRDRAFARLLRGSN